jgi:hypothetical protein
MGLMWLEIRVEVRVGVMWFCEFVRNIKRDFGGGGCFSHRRVAGGSSCDGEWHSMSCGRPPVIDFAKRMQHAIASHFLTHRLPSLTSAHLPRHLRSGPHVAQIHHFLDRVPGILLRVG